MEQFSDTIAAVCTGGVVSAVGILRLSGPAVLDVVEKVFSARSGRPVREFPDRKLIYGELRDREGRLLDLCLCTVSRAPNSYTGEDTAELQCHGSPMVLREGLESLFAAGARQAGPGEFTRRAFLNGRMDLTAAEAVADLIDAESPLAAPTPRASSTGPCSAGPRGSTAPSRTSAPTSTPSSITRTRISTRSRPPPTGA